MVLYARYRTGDYATVSKQSAAATTTATATTTSDANNPVVLRYLRAQSEFHLNRTEQGLAVYLQLLSGDSIDENDVESKMEVLTNALALIASSGCTPSVGIDEKNDENISFWLEEAEAMLLSDDDDNDEVVGEMFSDLASNLGCIRFLTNPTATDQNWLEEAADTGEDEAAKKGSPEQTNLQWSKHFWYKDIEDVHYDVPVGATATTAAAAASESNKMPVVQSVARVNQALLNENPDKLPVQPHPKWNLLQVRMYWYDRAVLQLKAGKHVECQDSCQSLKKTLSGASSGGKKKKKKTDAASSNAEATQAVSRSPAAAWWEARADVVLACAQQAQSKHKDARARLAERLVVLRAAAGSSSSSSSSLALDHAIAHVRLHQFVMEQQQQRQQKGGNKKTDRQEHRSELLELMNDLPESIRSSPAAQLTMDDLQTAVDNATSGNKTSSTPKSPLEEAGVLFGEGRYEEACRLYESALSGGSSSNTDDDDETVVDSKLRYVQALAMSGRHEASRELWQSLESSLDEETSPATESLPDGGALENKPLPRSSTAGNSIGKKLAATVGSNDDDDDEESKPSREKILRRRAAKRAAYLKKLEAKGKYNPDRPSKPDPERWIPKHERSRSSRNNRGSNRGGGGGRNNNKGLNSAQGGGSKLDAERLDAAARRAGRVPANSGPSSANLKVSSGGRKGGRRR